MFVISMARKAEKYDETNQKTLLCNGLPTTNPYKVMIISCYRLYVQEVDIHRTQGTLLCQLLHTLRARSRYSQYTRHCLVSPSCKCFNYCLRLVSALIIRLAQPEDVPYRGNVHGNREVPSTLGLPQEFRLNGGFIANIS